jgi:Uma2 family endonuclease
VIEVAGASLRKDRILKSEMYAEAGVTEYWVVNLRDRVVEVQTHPRGAIYENRQTVRPGEVVRLQSFPDIGIAIADLVE